MTTTASFKFSSIFKALLIVGLGFYLANIFLSINPCNLSSKSLTSSIFNGLAEESNTKHTDISHIVFGIASSSNTWRHRRQSVEEWWRPNITRGFLFLDKISTEYLPWSPSSPPFRVSENTSRFKDYDRHKLPFVIRIVRVLLEAFREERKDVRWYVVVDDDTVLFVDNLVEVLARYDHNKYLYIGESSEGFTSNYDYSFHMAFGGAGYALSYPLAKALAKNLDHCLKTYQLLYGSDHIIQSCVADLGVSLTHNRGFHQIDLHGDLSGFLSAHPPVPFISLHHLDHVEPIFPSMNRQQALKHLMKAAKLDPSRLLQQSICYQKENNWTFSISWGYSAHLYENIHPPSFLEKPLQTFVPWKTNSKPPFMFHTRFLSRDPCEMPHSFFFDSIEQANGSRIVTSYVRKSPRNLPTCSFSGNHSADAVMKIRVFSPPEKLKWVGRRECCDVVRISGVNVTEVRIRSCMEEEIVA